MSRLGVHFAIHDDEVTALLSIDDDHERLSYLHENIEKRYFSEFKQYLAESEKTWDAMHRALSDGHLNWTSGEYPLNHTVLGGRSLFSHGGYIISLKAPKQVQEIADALRAIDQTEFKRRYDRIDATSYKGQLSAEEYETAWRWFQGVRDLFMRAASENRYVLFSADL